MTFKSASCCGLREIVDLTEHETSRERMLAFCGGDPHNSDYGYDDYEEPGVFKYLTERPTHPSQRILGQFVFTEVTNRGNYGQQFAAYIRRNKLGSVQKSRGAKNPNHTENTITVYVWQPNFDSLWKWWQKNKAEWESKFKREESSYDSYYDNLW